MRYDVLIAGGGMAGLSLLRQLRLAGLHHLRVLIVDREIKKANDRTWCFWEKDPGPFEEIVFRSWDQVRVHGGKDKPLHLPLPGYLYKMIRGKDLYAFMAQQIEEDPFTDRVIASIQSIREIKDGAEVVTDQGVWEATTVFDSTWRMPMNAPGRHHLLQHFFGKIIQTDLPVFDINVPDLMHFGILQHDQCRFIYILPINPNKALVEFTVFSPELLNQLEYETVLDQYIRQNLGLENWQVDETEFGVIPMSDEPVKEFFSPHIIRIGTAGGYTNPATGYTFRPTQKRIAELVRHYQKTGSWEAPISLWQKRFNLYASVMLNVLEKKRVPAPELFYDLYKRNPIDRVFRFLDGETSFLEEVKFMKTLAIRKFFMAAGDVLKRRIRVK